MHQPDQEKPPHFSLDAELERRIEEYARSKGSTPAAVVREAFEQFTAGKNGGHSNGNVKSDETVYDAMSRAGLIGCIDTDGPTDLSTNKDYFKGFGRD